MFWKSSQIFSNWWKHPKIFKDFLKSFWRFLANLWQIFKNLEKLLRKSLESLWRFPQVLEKSMDICQFKYSECLEIFQKFLFAQICVTWNIFISILKSICNPSNQSVESEVWSYICTCSNAYLGKIIWLFLTLLSWNYLQSTPWFQKRTCPQSDPFIIRWSWWTIIIFSSSWFSFILWSIIWWLVWTLCLSLPFRTVSSKFQRPKTPSYLFI